MAGGQDDKEPWAAWAETKVSCRHEKRLHYARLMSRVGSYEI